MYSKTVAWFVDIRFISWPKIICPQEKKKRKKNLCIFFIKSFAFWKLYPLSRNTGIFFRVIYIQTISQKKNENQTLCLGIESQNVKEKCFPPKHYKAMYILNKICSGKRCNRYLSTVVFNVLKSNFEYIHSILNIAIQNECYFRWADLQSCIR